MRTSRFKQDCRGQHQEDARQKLGIGGLCACIAFGLNFDTKTGHEQHPENASCLPKSSSKGDNL